VQDLRVLQGGRTFTGKAVSVSLRSTWWTAAIVALFAAADALTCRQA